MKKAILMTLVLIAPSTFAADLLCTEDSVQDGAFAATFTEEATKVTLSIPTGENTAVSADASCERDDAMDAQRCDVETEKNGDYTVLLAIRNDKPIASVAPAMSMEVPKFLNCKEVEQRVNYF